VIQGGKDNFQSPGSPTQRNVDESFKEEGINKSGLTPREEEEVSVIRRMYVEVNEDMDRNS
jgi:hypothetical protein